MHRIKPRFAIQKHYTSKCILTVTGNSKPLPIEDMPRPKPLPFISPKMQFIISGSLNKLHEYIDIRHKELGPVFCEKLDGNSDLVFVSDPELIRSLFINLEGKYPTHILPDSWMLYESLYGPKRGLFFMNGNEWLNNRRIMNKLLLKDNSETWLEAPVKDAITKFIEQWKMKALTGNIVPNLESDLYRLSIDIILAVMMGNNTFLKSSDQYETLLNLFSDSVRKIFHTTTKLSGLPINWCQKFNMKVWRDFKECVDTSLLLAHKIVDEMIRNKQPSNGLINKLNEEKMTNDNIKKIVADFIIAAGDTTAYTSLWTMFSLAKDRALTKSLCMKQNSFANVVKESMRLYPVAPFLTRILPKECILGRYLLKEGTPIVASIYTSGRDEHNFSRADQFLPYRWDRNDPRRQELKNHVSSASLPFALGARSCIGKKLAMLQMSELVKQIVENFDLELVNKDEITAVTTQILVPNRDVKISFSIRTVGE